MAEPSNIDPIYQVERERLRLTLLASPRFADRRRLVPHGAKYFSQADEDGIIGYIFSCIGVHNGRFLEFGAGNGLENNSAMLLLQGWSGTWIELDEGNAAFARCKFRDYIEAGRLTVRHAGLTTQNINEVVAGTCAYSDIDLLSVDVDGNDFHLVHALERVHPRVIVVEYNAKFGPTASWIMPYDPTRVWDGTDYFGASLAALTSLLNGRGYELVGCNLVGTNAFFVLRSAGVSRFVEPFTPEEHFEPARYFLLPWPAGHPANDHADARMPLCATLTLSLGA